MAGDESAGRVQRMAHARRRHQAVRIAPRRSVGFTAFLVQTGQKRRFPDTTMQVSGGRYVPPLE
jgi:hypothetical protein